MLVHTHSDSNGETALITGASSGIGFEVARLLAAHRYRLVLVSRSKPRLEQASERLQREHGAEVRVCPVDLSESRSAERVAEFTATEGLQIDVLINNAGVGLYAEHVDLNTTEVDAMLQLNIGSLADLCLLYGRQMKARGKGRILNLASTAAYQPCPYFAAYGASKAFVLNFSEALAKELEDSGVTVSCLSPGPTDTAFFSDVDQKGALNGYLGKNSRVNAEAVARIGVELMMRGELSKIVGAKHFLRAWSARFASRAMVARISKNLLKPQPAGAD